MQQHIDRNAKKCTSLATYLIKISDKIHWSEDFSPRPIPGLCCRISGESASPENIAKHSCTWFRQFSTNIIRDKEFFFKQNWATINLDWVVMYIQTECDSLVEGGHRFLGAVDIHILFRLDVTQFVVDGRVNHSVTDRLFLYNNVQALLIAGLNKNTGYFTRYNFLNYRIFTGF